MDTLTLGQRPQSTMPEFLMVRASSAAATLVNRVQQPRNHQPIVGWRGMGEICALSQASKKQGAQFADFGGYDVTDTKFFTRVGPPPCSPPV